MKNESTTPDGRPFFRQRSVWRCPNPSQAEHVRLRLVNDLMVTRREVKFERAAADFKLVKLARVHVQSAPR
jgi:hypothetical protein